MDELSFPVYRVITFGQFSLQRLLAPPQAPEDAPCYEPIAERVWRSRSAACSLLKLLLCRTRRRAPRDLLIEALWPDVPVSNANHSLDTALSLLRGLLRPAGKESLLTTIHSGATTIYELPAQSVLWTDIDAFLSHVVQAENSVAQGSDPLPSFEAAWEIGSGLFLEDELYCQWAQARRQTITTTRHRVLHRLAELYLQRNCADRAEALLLKGLEEEPGDEDIAARLMEVLERQSRRQEALALYGRTRAILREEQGAEPGQQLQALAERLATVPPAAPQPQLPLAENLAGQIILSSYRAYMILPQSAPLMLVEMPQTSSCTAPQAEAPRSVATHVKKEYSLENMPCSEVLFYHIIKEICHGTGQEAIQGLLPATVDHLIRSCETMEKELVSRNSPLSRRDVMTIIAGLPVGFLLQHPVEQLSIVQTEEFLAQCAAGIAVCWQLMRGSDFHVVEKIIANYLTPLDTLVYRPSGYQKRAAKLAVQVRLLASLLALHQNNLRLREAHCQQAVTLSQVAQDNTLQIAAQMWLALTYHYARMPGKALQAYQKALPALGQATPLVQGCFSARMSSAYAQCGQEQEALRCIGQAQEIFPATPEHDAGFLLVDGGQYTLTLWEGLTRLDLDQPGEAWNALAAVDRLPATVGISERARLEIINHRAEAAVALGDMERFHSYIQAGITGARNLGSEKRYNEAAEVYKQARRLWPGEQKVKALQDLFVR